MPSGREFYGFLVSPDSATVLVNTDLLVANEYAWLRVPIDGSAPASRLTGPTRCGTFSPDGTSLLYIGENPFGIHTVLLDGSASPVFVAPLVGGVYGIAFADGGDRVHVAAHGLDRAAGARPADGRDADGGGVRRAAGRRVVRGTDRLCVAAVRDAGRGRSVTAGR